MPLGQGHHLARQCPGKAAPFLCNGADLGHPGGQCPRWHSRLLPNCCPSGRPAARPRTDGRPVWARGTRRTALLRPCQPLTLRGRTGAPGAQTSIAYVRDQFPAHLLVDHAKDPARCATVLLPTQQELEKRLRSPACQCCCEALRHHHTLHTK